MLEPQAVLQAILEARPVDVQDIRAALDTVSRPVGPLQPDAQLREAADLVVTIYRKWDAAMTAAAKGDDVEDFDIVDSLWDAIVALGAVLEGERPDA